MATILIVEDDIELNAIAKAYLEHAGFTTTCAFTSAQAEEKLAQETVDLILLDMMLPDRWGKELCTCIRETSNCPILFVSCIDDKETMLEALEVGGDDYMVKPVDYDKLVAKIKAILRRVNHYTKETETDKALWRYHRFYIDTLNRKVARLVGKKEELDLSPLEYQLLITLVENKGNLMLYGDLYKAVWQDDSMGDIRTVMVHISNLRKKLDPEQCGMITTVRGAGYFFTDVE